MQPNKQQQEAADNFVKMLDLAPTGKEEILQPDFTPNPILERFYRFLELKSKDPNACVPPLDETLRKIIEPDRDIISQNKPIIDDFRKCFEIKENPRIKKSSRRWLIEKPSGSEEERQDRITGPQAQPMEAIEYTSAVKVEKIGDLNPVADFEAMISRRDSPDWVNKAIQNMKDKIFEMVENSCEGDVYHKAAECLMALRKGCIVEQEPKQFNVFLLHLCKFCQEKDLKSFCEYLTSREVTLISKTEAPDSDVTDEAAKSFMLKSEPKPEPLF